MNEVTSLRREVRRAAIDQADRAIWLNYRMTQRVSNGRVTPGSPYYDADAYAVWCLRAATVLAPTDSAYIISDPEAYKASVVTAAAAKVAA